MRQLIFLTTLLFSTLPLMSWAGMRCGNLLISEGDNFAEVENICGAADSTIDMGTKVIYKQVQQGEQSAAIAESIKQDLWVYNRGPNKLIRNLYFENGILVRIESGGRGK